jgi:hypothetical protein
VTITLSMSTTEIGDVTDLCLYSEVPYVQIRCIDALVWTVLHYWVCRNRKRDEPTTS